LILGLPVLDSLSLFCRGLVLGAFGLILGALVAARWFSRPMGDSVRRSERSNLRRLGVLSAALGSPGWAGAPAWLSAEAAALVISLFSRACELHHCPPRALGDASPDWLRRLDTECGLFSQMPQPAVLARLGELVEELPPLDCELDVPDRIRPSPWRAAAFAPPPPDLPVASPVASPVVSRCCRVEFGSDGRCSSCGNRPG
jgi:hypothetical protein